MHSASTIHVRAPHTHALAFFCFCANPQKCRLWGKLQVLGLGTALKIVLEDHENCALDEEVLLKKVASTSVVGGDGEQGSGTGTRHVGLPAWAPLQRVEVIALINTLHRLSISVDHVQAMRSLELRSMVLDGSIAVVATAISLSLLALCLRSSKK